MKDRGWHRKGKSNEAWGQANVHAYFVTKPSGVRSGQGRSVSGKGVGEEFNSSWVMCELRTQGRENCGAGEDKRMGKGVSTLSILLLRWEELLLGLFLMVYFNEVLV